MRFLRLFSYALLLVSSSVSAAGLYQIELILFRQPVNAVPSSLPVPDDWNIDARPIDDDERRVTALDAQVEKLRAAGYKILTHQAWQQYVSSTPTQIAITDGRRQESHAPVEGTLTLTQSRFIDAKARFWVNLFNSDGDVQQSQLLKQEMHLKNGELTYMDHPSLGLLIKATPLDSQGNSLPSDMLPIEEAPAQTDPTGNETEIVPTEH